jgi:transposase
MVRQGNFLAPMKGHGRTPKVDEKAKKLLNEDMKERPAATIAGRIRFLQSITAKRPSYSAVWRLLKHLGWTLPTTLYELTTPLQRWS